MAEGAGTGRRGSIRHAANGTWYFVVDVTQPGGERRQTRRRGFATRRDAQRELTRVLASVDDRAYVEPKRQTVGGLCGDHSSSRSARRRPMARDRAQPSRCR
jgi:Arm DNA-binding domain